MRIEARLEELGLTLPAATKPPPGIVLPFSSVRIVGDRALISGHGAQNADGTLAGPFGKVDADVSVEQGYAAARLTALSILGSLQRALGDLDRVAAWQRLLGPDHRAVRGRRRARPFRGRHGRAPVRPAGRDRSRGPDPVLIRSRSSTDRAFGTGSLTVRRVIPII